MRRSLFRLDDTMELIIAYVCCFCINSLFDYVKTLELGSYILKVFIQNFMDYRILIVILFTLIVIVFHYQMYYRKKTEVYCRILVGDTIWNIAVRYFGDCLIVLGIVYLLSLLICAYLKLNVIGNIYLFFLFVVYIIISASQVRKYENF